jgi:hypothetical protein
MLADMHLQARTPTLMHECSKMRGAHATPQAPQTPLLQYLLKQRGWTLGGPPPTAAACTSKAEAGFSISRAPERPRGLCAAVPKQGSLRGSAGWNDPPQKTAKLPRRLCIQVPGMR